MKVYLAGKVSDNDWRHGIVGWELKNADGNGNCTQAIDDSDLVFAWLDDPSAFGSIWELGYAAGRGIHTAVGMPVDFDASDLWFSVYGAGQCYRASDPYEALTRAVERFDVKLMFNLCESPIERSVLTQLLALRRPGVEIRAQHQACGYRLDFALLGPRRKVSVECDGHDFHERTKAQARHDKQRDRKLQQAGWVIARFTGSEIHESAHRCAAEAMAMLTEPEAAE